MSVFSPDTVIETIYQLDGEMLSRRGVRLLLADLDNTLARYGQADPSAEAFLLRDRLAAHGVSLFVISNNRGRTRTARYCDKLGVPYISHAGKPHRRSFQSAMSRMGVSPAQTAMVGDQIFTDILGAKRAGIFSILVRPIRMDTVFRALRYRLETPFRKSKNSFSSHREEKESADG